LHVLKKEIYVDDVQTGHETIDGALKIRNDVIAALQSAGMELKKVEQYFRILPIHIQGDNTEVDTFALH